MKKERERKGIRFFVCLFAFSPYGVWPQDPWSPPPSPQTWSGSSPGSDASPCAQDCPRRRYGLLPQLSPACLSKDEAQEPHCHSQTLQACAQVRSSQQTGRLRLPLSGPPSPCRPGTHTSGRNDMAEVRRSGPRADFQLFPKPGLGIPRITGGNASKVQTFCSKQRWHCRRFYGRRTAQIYARHSEVVIELDKV